MSVFWGVEQPDDIDMHDFRGTDGVTARRKCFMCGVGLEYPYQVWRGWPAGGDYDKIMLHPKCAVQLAKELLVDAETAANGLEAKLSKVRTMARDQRGRLLEEQQESEAIIQRACDCGEEEFTAWDVSRWLRDRDPLEYRDQSLREDWRVKRQLAELLQQGMIEARPGGRYALTGKLCPAAGAETQVKQRDQLIRLSEQREAALRRELARIEAEFKTTSDKLAQAQAQRQVVESQQRPVRLDPQRNFSKQQKEEIRRRADGHCQGCGDALASDWHADHIVPHSRGGRTEIINGQALCRSCNGRKSAKVLTVDE